ncbi:MAG: hypothetical protein IMZ50_02745 [Candidatus Atribacteria bacterium]|nr:hypothetical protein [Candidatus Atribacteria bacterium]
MSPETIPWLLCGAFCLVPLLIGTGAFVGWCQITNRVPSRDVSAWVDEDEKKHVRTEWTWLTREEKKFRGQKEEEE